MTLSPSHTMATMGPEEKYVVSPLKKGVEERSAAAARGQGHGAHARAMALHVP
jgi:hypothetical protein